MPKRDKMCGSKTKHETRDGAKVEALRAISTGMNIYKCKSCGHWHIGKTRSPTRSADRITALLARHGRKIKSLSN